MEKDSIQLACPYELIPQYRETAAHHYVDITVVQPWPVMVGSKISYLTSAIKFGEKVDFLSLCSSKALQKAGLADITDSINPYITILKIYYRAKGCAVQIHDMKYEPDNDFVGLGRGKRGELCFDSRLMAIKDIPDTEKKDPDLGWWGMLWNSFRSAIARQDTFEFYLKGVINVETGELKMDAVTKDPDVELLGYVLHAYRVNDNRQYAEPETV